VRAGVSARSAAQELPLTIDPFSISVILVTQEVPP
jgi:hypothetical protein